MSNLLSILMIVLLAVAGCGNKDNVVGYDSNIEVTPQGGTYSSLRPTIYYLPRIDVNADSCSSNDLVDVRGARGQTIVTLCVKSYKTCLMQGTCLVVQNGIAQLLNYSGTQGGARFFTFTDRSICPFGFGVKKICLDPYFSVAADLSYHKAGDVIYVPKLRGVALPDGRTHDGYVIVRDTGGNIVGQDRFDFFTGDLNYKDPRNVFGTMGLASKKNRFQYTKVSADLAERIRKNRLFPRMR